MTDHVYRACGECFACCVWLGITPLKKWPGQTCKHLDGTIPDKRCRIYNQRPECCVTYSCAWRSGLGPVDGYRPDQCGVLVTPHPADDGDSRFIATVHVIDKKLAGGLNDPDSKLSLLISALLSMTDDVRVTAGGERAGSTILHFYKGAVYSGVVTPAVKGRYEDLNFVEEEEPIAHYQVKDLTDLTADDHAKIAAFKRTMQR